MNSLDSIYKAAETRSFYLTDIIVRMCDLIHRGNLCDARTIFQEEFRIPSNRPDATEAILPVTRSEYSHLKHIDRYNPEVNIFIMDNLPTQT